MHVTCVAHIHGKCTPHIRHTIPKPQTHKYTQMTCQRRTHSPHMHTPHSKTHIPQYVHSPHTTQPLRHTTTYKPHVQCSVHSPPHTPCTQVGPAVIHAPRTSGHVPEWSSAHSAPPGPVHSALGLVQSPALSTILGLNSFSTDQYSSSAWSVPCGVLGAECHRGPLG